MFSTEIDPDEAADERTSLLQSHAPTTNELQSPSPDENSSPEAKETSAFIIYTTFLGIGHLVQVTQ